MAAEIDLIKLRKICDYAKRLGYRVEHIHADVKKDPMEPFVRLDLWEEKKKK